MALIVHKVGDSIKWKMKNVQADGATCLRSPDEVEFYYLLLPSSTAFVRCALIDS